MKLIRYQYPNTTGYGSLGRLFDFGTPTFKRFKELFDDFLGAESELGQLPVDLYEDDKNFFARMELPGVKKEAINLELDNSVLTCSGNYSNETEKGKANYSFKRSISIPDGAASDQVSANYKDGILTVKMPEKDLGKTWDDSSWELLGWGRTQG